MRITLDLDDDLLSGARQLARERRDTLGHIISELARQSLLVQAPPKVRNGFPLLVPRPARSKPGLKTVNELRDEV